MKMLLVDVFSEKVFVVDAETLQDYCNFLKRLVTEESPKGYPGLTQID